MNRRQFLGSAAAAGLALQQFPFGAFAAAADKAPRVGLIGCGWYGKCDLLRLIQVAPVEVVSLCDVDKKMLAEAADIVAGRQASKKKPRTYADYRDMLKEKDLDIVLIATPDHWHALPMIAAVEAGADVYVQKPISVDVVEGQAMVAAARKHKRVVQVGTQRRSTPHLIEARDTIVKEGKLGKIGLVEIYCYYHMRATREPAGHEAAGEPRLRNVDRPGADAAVQQAGPSARLAGLHGVRQRHRRRHVHPHARHGALDARPGLAEDASAPAGGILVDKESKANITDTQTATFDFGDLQVVWQHRTWGDAARPEVSVGRDDLRRQGHAQGERASATTSRRTAAASRSART